jgi:hypothetical protein
MRARLGAHASWARTEDRTARMAPAWRASMARFDREVDPEGVLPEDERARRAEHARKAYFTRLALLSSRARTKARALDAEADAAAAELAAAGGDTA